MAGFSGKGKERLCKDELFVAIFASIKLNRDRVRALRFDRGEARIVPTNKKRIKELYRAREVNWMDASTKGLT